jgi:hypothetical protein
VPAWPGIVGNGQQQANGFGFQLAVEIDEFPVKRLALAVFLYEPLGPAAGAATAPVHFDIWRRARHHHHAAVAANFKAVFRRQRVRPKGHRPGFTAIAHIDLAQDDRSTILDAKGQALIADRAGGAVLGEIEAADDLVKFAFAFLAAIPGETVVMFHIRQRLRAREGDKRPLLTAVQLARSVVIVTALRAGRRRIGLVQLGNPSHVTTGAADGPVFDEGIWRITNGDLLDVKAATVGIKMIGGCQFLQRRLCRPNDFDGLVRLLGSLMAIVDGAVKAHPAFGKGVVGKQPVVGQDFQGRHPAQAIGAALQNAQLLLDFALCVFFFHVELAALIPQAAARVFQLTLHAVEFTGGLVQVLHEQIGPRFLAESFARIGLDMIFKALEKSGPQLIFALRHPRHHAARMAVFAI